MEQSEGGLAQEILQPQKVLRIKEDYGVYTDNRFLVMGTDPQNESNIVKVFEDNGYTISRGGKFNQNNPLELGIYLKQKNNEELARELDLPTPQKKPLSELLDSTTPVIVKLLEANRGEGKYLLETEEQRARLITWVLCLNTGFFQEQDQETIRREVPKLLEKVRAQELTDDELQQIDQYNHWVVEDYIETPSEYNTSYRILVDGYGNLHYGQINRSGYKKEMKKIVTEDKDGVIFFDRPGRLGDDTFSLLTHERSPLFIGSKDFRSNIAQGGERILLNGNAISSDTNRYVLIALGMDPDKPEIPIEILEMARKVGIASRDSYPYVGVDFIQGKDGKYFFIEANIGARLNSEGLGMSGDNSQEELGLELIRRISN